MRSPRRSKVRPGVRARRSIAGASVAWQVPAVTPIRARRPNAYAGSPLDRATARREDADWLAVRLAESSSLFVPVWRSKNLMTGVAEARPEAVYLSGDAADAVRTTAATADSAAWALLGVLSDRAVFSVDLSNLDDPLPLVPSEFGTFTDLRAVAGALPARDASVLAHARGLMHWRNRHRFCGVCGTACVPRSAGNVMLCTGCGTQHFPRTDPAVIMLVTRADRALLGHSQRFPIANMYSTLAGFVEPGESLEEAVAREVFEETAIRVGDVHYHSSQPWPFPSSIMLGFTADALNDDIAIDPEELRDARWFTRAQMRDPAAHGFALPRIDSIARHLIDDWMSAA
jgi:NAD+ diphosphatase